MDGGKKRKREEGNPQVKLNFGSKYWDDQFGLLVAKFDGFVNERSVKDAIVESVINEERDHYTKTFNEREVPGSREDSSDDSVASYLNPYSVSTE